MSIQALGPSVNPITQPLSVRGYTPLSLPALGTMLVWLASGAGTWQDTAFVDPADADSDPLGGWEGHGGVAADATSSDPMGVFLSAWDMPVVVRQVPRDPYRPLYRTSGPHGHPYASWDGTQGLFLPNLDAAALTVVLACYRERDFVASPAVETLVASVTAGGWTLHFDAGNHLSFGVAGGAVVAGSMTHHAGLWQVLTVRWDGATAAFYVNGAAAGSSACAPTFNSSGSRYGLGSREAGDYAAVRVPELLVYSTALSASARALAESYLIRKYALTNGKALDFRYPGNSDYAALLGGSPCP